MTEAALPWLVLYSAACGLVFAILRHRYPRDDWSTLVVLSIAWPAVAFALPGIVVAKGFGRVLGLFHAPRWPR